MNRLMKWWKTGADDLADEIQTHIDLETQRNIEAGMLEDEARYAAARKFGNALLAKQESREVWGWLWLEHLFKDVRYVLRGFRKAPGFTATVVLTLALGLSSATAMLAIVHSVLIRPLALPHPEQLMLISCKGPAKGNGSRT